MAKAPLIYYEGGRFWTGSNALSWADCLAASGGRVLAVGKREELGWLRAYADRVVDLQGHIVVPGFNDAHVHAFEGGKSLLEIDLRSVTSIDQFKFKLKQYAQQLPREEWITGGNWDHQQWRERRYPTRYILDEVTGPRPAVLFRVDWHVAVANTAALRAAGIDRNTPNPPGGEIERDKHGEPTGIVKDAAADLILSHAPEPDDKRLRQILSAATSEALRLGVTSYQDNVTSRVFHAYQTLAKSGELPVRVSAWFPLSELEHFVGLGLERNFGDSLLDVGTIKLFADGSLGAETAYFFEPYVGKPGYRGLLMMTEPELRQMIARIQAAGLQAAVHAIGDAANALVLDAFEKVEEAPNGRHRIEHAQTVRDTDVSRFAQLGIVASVQPVHAVEDLPWAAEKIGDRITRSYRLRSLLQEGVQVAIGTDWPVAPLNPMNTLAAAVFRKIDEKSEWPFAAEIASETIPVEQALRLYTWGSAYAQGREREKGTLEPDKLADFVVLNRDIFRSREEELRETRVLMTIVGGEILYES